MPQTTSNPVIPPQVLPSIRAFPGLQPIALSAALSQRFGSIRGTSTGAILVSSKSGFHFLAGQPARDVLPAVREERVELGLESDARYVLVPIASGWSELLRTIPDLKPDERISFRIAGFTALPPKVSVTSLAARHIEANLELPIVRDTLHKWGSSDAVVREALVSVVLDGDRILSCAATSAIAEGAYEVNVATRSEARGRGLAYAACHHLISMGQARGLAPHWNCVVGNTASRRLAESLGFRECARYPIFVAEEIPRKQGT